MSGQLQSKVPDGYTTYKKARAKADSTTHAESPYCSRILAQVGTFRHRRGCRGFNDPLYLHRLWIREHHNYAIHTLLKVTNHKKTVKENESPWRKQCPYHVLSGYTPGHLCRVIVQKKFTIIVQDSPKRLLLKAYESINEVTSGNSGCKASPDA